MDLEHVHQVAQHPVQHRLGRQLATPHHQVPEVREVLAVEGSRGGELQLQQLHQLRDPAGQVRRHAQQEDGRLGGGGHQLREGG
jgi:hypothetical protein